MYKTFATLKEDTPFNAIFPDRFVPLKSIIPIVPRGEGMPECYVVEASQLADDQIEQLAELLYPMWSPECESVDQAIAYILGGLPLKTSWFSGCSTSDPKVIYTLIELDELEWNEIEEEWQ